MPNLGDIYEDAEGERWEVWTHALGPASDGDGWRHGMLWLRLPDRAEGRFVEPGAMAAYRRLSEGDPATVGDRKQKIHIHRMGYYYFPSRPSRTNPEHEPLSPRRTHEDCGHTAARMGA